MSNTGYWENEVKKDLQEASKRFFGTILDPTDEIMARQFSFCKKLCRLMYLSRKLFFIVPIE